jgi:competence protein ComGC
MLTLWKNKNGFTLIEGLLIVCSSIVIIVILGVATSVAISVLH